MARKRDNVAVAGSLVMRLKQLLCEADEQLYRMGAPKEMPLRRKINAVLSETISLMSMMLLPRTMALMTAGYKVDALENLAFQLERETQLQSLALDEDRGSCYWKENEDDGGWETACGNMFVLETGTPQDNGMMFCCYCGRSLRPNR